LLLAKTTNSHSVMCSAIERINSSSHSKSRYMTGPLNILPLDHCALLLLVPAIPTLGFFPLLLPVINNLKIDIILQIIISLN